MSRRFSCYIISETTLGLQCAQLFIEKNNELLGLISTHQETCQWASENDIPCFSSIDEFENFNANKTFDYFFSIVNSHIIPKSILQLARYCSINYHDSLLPNYAGMHATSWAILNGEKTHGISWHVMSDLIDGGDILMQATFPIESDETTFSLNLKCYTYAVQTF